MIRLYCNRNLICRREGVAIGRALVYMPAVWQSQDDQVQG
nr:MAG TPA: hypothetical protein [Caudoviricetes sp.]